MRSWVFLSSQSPWAPRRCRNPDVPDLRYRGTSSGMYLWLWTVVAQEALVCWKVSDVAVGGSLVNDMAFCSGIEQVGTAGAEAKAEPLWRDSKPHVDQPWLSHSDLACGDEPAALQLVANRIIGTSTGPSQF
ncbi:hypothetical protein CC2G_003361 [Coprinopsis cinerea AmutBmut pab1-1]|nr:hypothetical protein CC2G_003361 [Coprinopsis cinerea AmutBmut pab1-1]